MQFLLVFLALACACAPAREEPEELDTPNVAIGSYGVSYVEDEVSLDDVTVAAVRALEKVYPDKDFNPLLHTIVVAYGDLPEGVDGASRAGKITLRRHTCAGDGSLAHELAHLVAEYVTGNGDSGHHDTRLFLDDCKTNACAWSTVEMAGRPLCD